MAALLLAVAGVGVLCVVRDAPPPMSPAPQAPPSGGAPSPTPPAPVPAPAAAPATDESQAVDRLRRLVSADAQQALALAAELDRAYPNSSHAEERASLTIDALVKTGNIGQARTNAEEFLLRYPNGRFASHVTTLTGVHPRPTGPAPRGDINEEAQRRRDE